MVQVRNGSRFPAGFPDKDIIALISPDDDRPGLPGPVRNKYGWHENGAEAPWSSAQGRDARGDHHRARMLFNSQPGTAR
jgi:hypothetical protein